MSMNPRQQFQGMKEHYIESERQFIEFTTIIPLSHNPDNVYSPRLWSILQSVASQIEGMFRILTAELNLHPINDTFVEFYKSLNVGGVGADGVEVLLPALIGLDASMGIYKVQ